MFARELQTLSPLARLLHPHLLAEVYLYPKGWQNEHTQTTEDGKHSTVASVLPMASEGLGEAMHTAFFAEERRRVGEGAQKEKQSDKVRQSETRGT